MKLNYMVNVCKIPQKHLKISKVMPKGQSIYGVANV